MACLLCWCGEASCTLHSYMHLISPSNHTKVLLVFLYRPLLWVDILPALSFGMMLNKVLYSEQLSNIFQPHISSFLPFSLKSIVSRKFSVKKSLSKWHHPKVTIMVQGKFNFATRKCKVHLPCCTCPLEHSPVSKTVTGLRSHCQYLSSNKQRS